jgi:hypothetical protein
LFPWQVKSMALVEKRWSVGIQVAIMLGTIGVFLAIVELVGGGYQSRSPQFWVTVSSIVFALHVWFNIPLWMAATDARKRTSFPYAFTALTFSTFYGMGIGVLALVAALTPITTAWLVSIHLVLLLIFGVSMGVYALAGRAIDAMDTADQRSKAGHANLVLHCQEVCDQASLLDGEAAQPLRAAFDQLKEDVQMATGESLPGSESADQAISSHLTQLGRLLAELQDAPEDTDTSAMIDQLQREVQMTGQALTRREQLIASLR